jgi:hypothetical protein
MFLDGEDSTSLMQLCWHWDHDYQLAVVDGTWTAVPRSEPDDPEAVLTAPDAWSLRMLLREDSAARRARQRTS